MAARPLATAAAAASAVLTPQRSPRCGGVAVRRRLGHPPASQRSALCRERAIRPRSSEGYRPRRRRVGEDGRGGGGAALHPTQPREAHPLSHFSRPRQSAPGAAQTAPRPRPRARTSPDPPRGQWQPLEPSRSSAGWGLSGRRPRRRRRPPPPGHVPTARGRARSQSRPPAAPPLLGGQYGWPAAVTPPHSRSGVPPPPNTRTQTGPVALPRRAAPLRLLIPHPAEAD